LSAAGDSTAVAVLTSDSTDVPDDSLAIAEESKPEEPEVFHLFDISPVVDSLSVMRVSLQDIRFQLGEILLFDLHEPDSARTIFIELTTSQTVDSVRARATLALAYIAALDSNFTEYDSLRKELAENFTHTQIGKKIAEKLGHELPEVEKHPAELAFKDAEELMFAEAPDYEEVFTKYNWVVETYPESEFAPMAMYASAFVVGAHLDDGSTAKFILKSLQDRFSGTDQSSKAAEMLRKLEELRLAELEGDSTALEPSEAELEAYSEDELAVKPSLIGGQESLGNVLESKNLLPQEVLSGTGGDVLIRFVVNEAGEPHSFRVLMEDPPGKGLSQALIAGLEEVAFQPGRLEEEPVSTVIERRFTLPLDAPPNVRPLPRRFRG
ncbi:hypothetical protein K8I28_07540, partial [bacterium]|nr:hypothetical protein [bacterium]